ncbi:hypothetical protein AM232_07810 [Bacillus sp. FJAT-21352]|nr:hypothetical protein AM232_07810 [Bacillus sp. FJAT-21352]
MNLQCFDRTLIQDYSKTQEVNLTVTVPITRPCVFSYQWQNGTIQMEAKLPDEIFSDRTICSARSIPVKDDHPNKPVSTREWKLIV